jgi:hypothetical protein
MRLIKQGVLGLETDLRTLFRDNRNIIKVIFFYSDELKTKNETDWNNCYDYFLELAENKKENEKLFLCNIQLNTNIKDIKNICIRKYDSNNKEKILFPVESLINLSFFESVILTKVNISIDELNCLCEFPDDQIWKLIFRATRDGFKGSQFHDKCDNKPNTLVLIKSEYDNVFGGYTEQSWSFSKINQGHKTDSNAFIFSLINEKNTPLKMKCINQECAIKCSNLYGPFFGNNDLYICDNSNSRNLSHSLLGQSYKHPKYAQGSKEANSFLGGSLNFKVLEIEVFTKI